VIARRLVVGAALVVLAGSVAPASEGQTSLRWRDEFSGPAGGRLNRAHWRHEIGERWGNGELQAYTARTANAALDGHGHLVMTARRERHVAGDGSVWRYTSARLNTAPRLDFAYGLVEARMRVPRGAGLHAAFWGLGSDLPAVGWPRAGEFDVMEVRGAQPRTVMGSLHGPRGTGDKYALHATRVPGGPVTSGFHVYGMAWSPERVTFLFDGQPYGRLTPADVPEGGRWVFDHPFHLLLTLAVGGEFAGSPTARTHWPARMVVDWIRVYKEAA
jgi:beta-glucanase (GH16 family)